MRSVLRLLAVGMLLSPAFAHAGGKIVFEGKQYSAATIKRNVNKALKQAMFSPAIAKTAPSSRIALLPARDGKIEWKVVGRFRYERGTVVPGLGVKGVEIDQSTIGLEGVPGR